MTAAMFAGAFTDTDTRTNNNSAAADAAYYCKISTGQHVKIET